MAINKLRDQITETQKVRSDLMKWKLLLVAGIGTVVITKEKTALTRPEVLLCLIPLVCVYVDALCAHLSLRIRATGEFILTQPTEAPDELYAQNYEKFIRRWKNENRLEPFALFWSTIFLSLLVTGVGILRLVQNAAPSLTVGYIGLVGLLLTGVGGIAMALWIRAFHAGRVEVIKNAGCESIRPQTTVEKRDSMNERTEAVARDLQTQWQDHFHMRDQTWKVLQYSILFFIGVVGLEIKPVDKTFLVPAYLAVLCTTAFGVVVALHHRRRQKEKFRIIQIYERELGLDALIKPVLDEAHSSITGRVNTSTYIVAMQTAIFVVATFLLCRVFLS